MQYLLRVLVIVFLTSTQNVFAQVLDGYNPDGQEIASFVEVSTDTICVGSSRKNAIDVGVITSSRKVVYGVLEDGQWFIHEPGFTSESSEELFYTACLGPMVEHFEPHLEEYSTIIQAHLRLLFGLLEAREKIKARE